MLTGVWYLSLLDFTNQLLPAFESDAVWFESGKDDVGRLLASEYFYVSLPFVINIDCLLPYDCVLR